MIVDNIQFAAFSKNLEISDKCIRRKIEDSLKDYFTFSFYNPPSPPDIEILPNLIGYTQHGHSRLQISKNLARLFVTFDEAFEKDFGKSFNYACEKIDIISKVLNTLDENFYSGSAVQYLFDKEKSTENIIDSINRDSVKIIGDDGKFFSFSKQFALVYRERFYLNFSISSLKPMSNQETLLGVKVDINNRYASEIKKQSVGYSDIEIMNKLHLYIAENALDKLLTKGELNLNEKN